MSPGPSSVEPDTFGGPGLEAGLVEARGDAGKEGAGSGSECP